MSSYTLIIGNKNYSSWSLEPWLWMKQAGIDFQEKRVALYLEDSDQQLASYFSNYKVPVLLDDELTVWDSLAILEYLADKHPEKTYMQSIIQNSFIIDWMEAGKQEKEVIEFAEIKM
jgi:glutathione S-transferase